MPDWKWIHTPGHTVGHISLPSLTIPSHGKPMVGDNLAQHLDYLVNHFDEIAVPDQGRFVN